MEEFPHLQGLQADLKLKGVQLLGFNCADDAELARRFLKRAGVTFPTILDSSKQAVNICHQQYGAQGVPAHYIISDGWVVESWMGFERDYHPAFEALGKLGLK